MEQQQTELYAMIGELTYRLQLAQRENERLVDESHTMNQERRAENHRMREERTNMVNEYNMTLNTCEDLRRENEMLRERLATAEVHSIMQADIINNQLAGLYVSGRPQRQDSVIDHALLMTDEQMDGFYGGGAVGGLHRQASVSAMQMTDDDAMEIDEPIESCCLQRQASNSLMTDEEIQQYYGENSAEVEESLPEWA
jgi:hypothetical protein